MTYRPTYFTIEELVPPTLLDKFGAERLWWVLDSRMLWTIDRLRERWGSLVANTWKQGGQFKDRGLRDFMSLTGATLSDHKFGRAIDLTSSKLTAEEMRADIRAHIDLECFSFITVVEENVSWLHIGFRNVPRIQWVEP